MLFNQDLPGQAQQGRSVGKHSHDLGAMCDFFVGPFQWVRRPDLAPVAARKRGEGRESGVRVSEHRGDVGGLLLSVLPIRLGEDCADDRGNHLLQSLRHHREDVP